MQAPPKAPDIASASALDTLSALHVDAEVGLTLAEVEVRRKVDGYNEVAETESHPVLAFLRKFWGQRARLSRGGCRSRAFHLMKLVSPVGLLMLRRIVSGQWNRDLRTVHLTNVAR